MKDSHQTINEEEFLGKYIDSDRGVAPQNQGKKKRKLHALKMNVSDTQYPVVKFVGKKIMRWQLDYSPLEDLNFDLCWTDNAVKPEILARMQPHQKINHFPGMYVLSRKNNLGKNLMRLKKYDPEQYNFFPQTFVLPGDFAELRQYHQNRKPGKAQTFIVKPEAGCQGRGIFLTRNIEKIKNGDRCVVQRYLHKPFLIEGLKFDMRIYVLITGTDPLRIYVYEEGLVRFATEPYVTPKSDNLDEVCMHLTNYAINKDSPNFIFNESTKDMNVGHKRSLTSVYSYLAQQGYDIEKLKDRINDIFIKTFISGHPGLSSMYKSCQSNNFSNNMCFELLGFDVILDAKFNPILLEVNYTPSFSTDTPLDSLIKKNAIRDTLRHINLTEKIRNELKNKREKDIQDRLTTGKRKKWTEEEKLQMIETIQHERDLNEDSKLGGFKKIYPLNDTQVKKYQRFFQYAHEMEGTTYNGNSKSLIPIEKKVQLQKKLMKTYQLEPSQQKLRKNTSVKMKSRDATSNTKVNKPLNLSSDKLTMDAQMDVSCDIKARLTNLDRLAKNKNKKWEDIENSDEKVQQVYLFTNHNLKDIVVLPSSQKGSSNEFKKKKIQQQHRQ